MHLFSPCICSSIFTGSKSLYWKYATTRQKRSTTWNNVTKYGGWSWKIRAVATVWEGSFFQKYAKIAHNISKASDFRKSQLRNDYRSPEIRFQMVPLWDVLFSLFTIKINSVFPLDCTFRTRKVLFQILVKSDVRYCALKPIVNSTPQCWCGLASDILKKSRLNWKLKISNTADNADLSQARDARYRQMQELNSLCVNK